MRRTIREMTERKKNELHLTVINEDQAMSLKERDQLVH